MKLIEVDGFKIIVDNDRTAKRLIETLQKEELNQKHIQYIIGHARECTQSGKLLIHALDDYTTPLGSEADIVRLRDGRFSMRLATINARNLYERLLHESTHFTLELAYDPPLGGTYSERALNFKTQLRKALCKDYWQYSQIRTALGRGTLQYNLGKRFFGIPASYPKFDRPLEHICYGVEALSISEAACNKVAPNFTRVLKEYIEYEWNKRPVVSNSSLNTPRHTIKTLGKLGLSSASSLLQLIALHQTYTENLDHYRYLEEENRILQHAVATSVTVCDFSVASAYWVALYMTCGTGIGLTLTAASISDALGLITPSAATPSEPPGQIRILSEEEIKQKLEANIPLWRNIEAIGNDPFGTLDDGSLEPTDISLIEMAGRLTNQGMEYITDGISWAHDAVLTKLGYSRPIDPAKTLQASLGLQQARHELQSLLQPPREFRGDIISNTLQPPVHNTPASSSGSGSGQFHFSPLEPWIKKYQIDPINANNKLRTTPSLPPKFDMSFHFSPDGFQLGATTSFGYNLPHAWNFKQYNQTPATQSFFNGSKTFSDLFGAIAVPVIEHYMDWEDRRYQEREAHAVKKQVKIITQDCEEKFFGKYKRICNLYNAYNEESDSKNKDALLITLRVEANNFFPEAQNFLYQYQSYKPDTKKYKIGGHRVRSPVYNFIQNNLLPVIQSIVEEKLPQLDKGIKSLEAEARNFKLEEGITNAYKRYLNKEICFDDLIKLRLSNGELIINNLLLIMESLHGRDKFKVNLLIEKNRYQLLALQNDTNISQAAHDYLAGTIQPANFNVLFKEKDSLLSNRVIFLENMNKKKRVHTDQRNENNAEIAEINDQIRRNRDYKSFIEHYYIKNALHSDLYDAFNGYLSGTMTKDDYNDIFLACQNSYLPLLDYCESQPQTQETIDQINELKNQRDNNEEHNAFINNYDASNNHRSIYYETCNDLLNETINHNKFEEKYIAYKDSLDLLSAYFEQQLQRQQEKITKVLDNLKNINKNNGGKRIVINSLIESEFEEAYQAYIIKKLTEEELKAKFVAFKLAFLLIPDIDKKQVEALFDILIKNLEIHQGINTKINNLKENKHREFCKFIQTLITANAAENFILSVIEQHRLHCTDECQLIVIQHFQALVKGDIDELCADFKSLKKLPDQAEQLGYRTTTLYKLTALLDEKKLAKKNLGLLLPEEQITALWVELFSETSDLLDQEKSQPSEESSELTKQYTQHQEQAARRIIEDLLYERNREFIRHGKNASYCYLTVDVLRELFPDAIKQTLHLSDQQFANLDRVVSNSFAAISTYINQSIEKVLSDPISAIIQKTGLPEFQALSLYTSYVRVTSGAGTKPEGPEVVQGALNKAIPYVTVAKLAISIADFLLQMMYENDVKELDDKPDFKKWLDDHFLANCAQSASTMINYAASTFSTAQELLSIAILLHQGPDKMDKLTYVRKIASSLINMPYLHQMVHYLMRDQDGKISEHPLYIFYCSLIENMQTNAMGQQLICKHQDTIIDGITEIFTRNTFFETLANTITLQQDTIRNVWFYARSFVNGFLALANYRTCQAGIVIENVKLDFEEIADLMKQGDISLITQKALMMYSDLKDKLLGFQKPEYMQSELRQLYITVLFRQHLLDYSNPAQIEPLLVEGDGLFESISVLCQIPVAGLRIKVALHIIKNKNYYEPLIDGCFDAFISRLRNHASKDLFQAGEPPYNTVIHALSEVVGRPIIIAFNGIHLDLERQGLDKPSTIKLADPIFLAHKQVGPIATYRYQIILLRGEAFAEADFAKMNATKPGLPQLVLPKTPKFFSTPPNLKERVKHAQAAMASGGGTPLIMFMGGLSRSAKSPWRTPLQNRTCGFPASGSREH